MIKQANYLISSPRVEQCPASNRPEFAFIGRSNVGKSSLINMLANQKDLAKTSSSPGKTQMINHFEVNRNEMYWVDLPGYGYAKVSKKQRQSFHSMIWNYLEQRENLVNLFALIDSRHKPQQIDLDFINELGKRQIPFAIVFTKSDKSKQSDVMKNVNAFNAQLLKQWEELPPMFLTSAVKKRGGDDMLAFMAELLKK
jgi:GTP-binding protein